VGRRVPPAAWLGLILLAAAALRFYGLAWGAPYFHFHIDEHFVFVGAERLRVSMKAAADSGKFFMYGTVPMHLLNGLVWVHDHLGTPLNLKTFDDQVLYTTMGRMISATMGTLTVWLVYFIARRVAGTTAGLIAAALLATAVLHIAESHSFRVDLTMIFFVVLAWLYAFRIAEHGRLSDYLLAGVAAGAAFGSKYTGVFIVGVIGLAHLLSPGRPTSVKDVRGWVRWTLRGISPLVAAAIVFAIVNPMAFMYSDKFFGDIKEQITDPLSGVSRPLWIGQFADVQPQLYWFTNMWWSLGPALEWWGIAGLIWLLWRRTPAALIAAACPIIYLLATGWTIAPMARYTMALAPAFAVSAGCLSAFLLERPRWRMVGIAATALVVSTTALYALAYMNVYRATDARLEASAFLESHIPRDSRIIVEPSHGIPPTGAYLKNPDFFSEHVLFGARREQHDYYWLYTLDVYQFLYRRDVTPDQKREYIRNRLALGDYILMDDFFLQIYRHLPASEHAVVKQYYDDLFSGALGFDLMKTFKVYPKLFGVTINDDGAELSSRMNDHPRVYLFIRRQPLQR
jgi:hypothetical protein